jgi:type I restriction enzyme S subunit
LADGQGGGFTCLRKKQLSDFAVPVPPSPEQERLVSLIDALTDRLDQIREARQTARIAVDSLFQRALEIAFSDDGTDDWNEFDADELFEIVTGQVSPLAAQFRDLPYLGPEHVDSGTGRIIGERRSVAELKMKSGKYRFTPENVVYSKIRPALRKVCAPDFSGLCSADMYALKPNTELITRSFLKFLLLAPAFSAYAVEKSDRNAMPKINQTALRTYRFRIPEPPEQDRIAIRLTMLLDRQTELRELQREMDAEMTAFTPALLAKAFRGEL